MVDVTTGTRRSGKLRYDENHVTLVDEAEQRRHVSDYCRLVPDLTKAGGCKEMERRKENKPVPKLKVMPFADTCKKHLY